MFIFLVAKQLQPCLIYKHILIPLLKMILWATSLKYSSNFNLERKLSYCLGIKQQLICENILFVDTGVVFSL